MHVRASRARRRALGSPRSARVGFGAQPRLMTLRMCEACRGIAPRSRPLVGLPPRLRRVNGEAGAHVRASRARRGAVGSPRSARGGAGRSPV